MDGVLDTAKYREGSKLTLLGEEFRPVGTNIYWLGLDENVMYEYGLSNIFVDTNR
jgi:hypothetical protein